MTIRVDKWYFDLVTSDGTVAVAHQAVISLGGLRLRYAGLLVSSRGETPAVERHRAAFRPRRVPAPQTERSFGIPPAKASDVMSVRWRLPGVARGVWRGHHGSESDAPIDLMTLGEFAPSKRVDERLPSIEWMPVLPVAKGRLTLADGRTVTGRGRVERLRLVASRPSLPIDVMHWGRFVADAPGADGGDGGAAWIRWEGPHPLDQAWCGASSVDPESIRRSLRLEPGRLIRTGPLDATVLGRVPRWARRFGASIGEWREERSLHRATLAATPGTAPCPGWVVAERVVLHPGDDEACA